jgi:hypothetical protein
LESSSVKGLSLHAPSSISITAAAKRGQQVNAASVTASARKTMSLSGQSISLEPTNGKFDLKHHKVNVGPISFMPSTVSVSNDELTLESMGDINLKGGALRVQNDLRMNDLMQLRSGSLTTESSTWGENLRFTTNNGDVQIGDIKMKGASVNTTSLRSKNTASIASDNTRLKTGNFVVDSDIIDMSTTASLTLETAWQGSIQFSGRSDVRLAGLSLSSGGLVADQNKDRAIRLGSAEGFTLRAQEDVRQDAQNVHHEAEDTLNIMGSKMTLSTDGELNTANAMILKNMIHFDQGQIRSLRKKTLKIASPGTLMLGDAEQHVSVNGNLVADAPSKAQIQSPQVELSSSPDGHVGFNNVRIGSELSGFELSQPSLISKGPLGSTTFQSSHQITLRSRAKPTNQHGPSLAMTANNALLSAATELKLSSEKIFLENGAHGSTLEIDGGRGMVRGSGVHLGGAGFRVEREPTLLRSMGQMQLGSATGKRQTLLNSGGLLELTATRDMAINAKSVHFVSDVPVEWNTEMVKLPRLSLLRHGALISESDTLHIRSKSGTEVIAGGSSSVMGTGSDIVVKAKQNLTMSSSSFDVSSVDMNRQILLNKNGGDLSLADVKVDGTSYLLGKTMGAANIRAKHDIRLESDKKIWKRISCWRQHRPYLYLKRTSNTHRKAYGN